MTVDESKLEPYIRYLPDTTRSLVELIGVIETQQLLDRFGGTKRYVPKCSADKSPLRSVMSEKAFYKLCAVYSGEILELPKPDSLRRVRRNIEIALLTAQGASRTQLVHLYGLTYRQIGNIRRRYRLAAQQ